jgi:hypothetical protein
MCKFGLLLLLCIALKGVDAQSIDSLSGKILSFPSRLLGHIQSRTADLNHQLTRQTEKYLSKMMKQEQRMQKKLMAVDSNGAKTLFANSQQQYKALIQRLKTDTGSRKQLLSLTGGNYQPYIDSLQGSLSFLQKNSQLLNNSSALQSHLQGATSQLQAYEAKMQDASQAQAFIRQRKQQITQYINAHANLQNLLNKPLSGLNQQAYYYSQQLRQYREMWNSPDKLQREALSILNKLPSFQSFMKNNSQVSGLFGLPSSAGATSQALSGLQTRDQITKLVQNQLPAVSPGGGGGLGALQSKIQSAQSQLDSYKQKLSQLGTANSNMDVPDFKPNDQKTKTFLQRLEYGFNFQSTRNNYYFPTVTDFGLSLGYKLGHSNVIGVGASYKLGWGNGIQHVALSSEGVGLRSFINIKIKGSFSAAGGFEYNYTTPFRSFNQLPQIQNWTKSGLLGITKTVSMKNRFLKQTTLSLLWDFLSYQQTPPTQPVLFRVGYVF